MIQRCNSVNFTQIHTSNTCVSNTIPINLALIQINYRHFHFFDYSLLNQQGNHILGYCEILNDDRRVVVLQGLPGSGKTTLVKCFCNWWANGKVRTTKILSYSFCITP